MRSVAHERDGLTPCPMDHPTSVIHRGAGWDSKVEIEALVDQARDMRRERRRVEVSWFAGRVMARTLSSPSSGRAGQRNQQRRIAGMPARRDHLVESM